MSSIVQVFAQERDRQSSGFSSAPFALRYIVLAYRVFTERQALASMNDDQLIDIGITRSEANREVARDLLDLPEERKAMLSL